ncbi:hypothetical protein BDFB_008077 [Asbolus verrucosus]|uniref:Uncharacterized protein n=1 Tax=Asbolus verrucosus TaxID=1661398 RepID=A0A482W9L1_ASBVE|nr:hypothetical protein BDFB_008077 [Asbolus verrucosus]
MVSLVLCSAKENVRQEGFKNLRCFCYSSAGNRIFGQEWWKKADNMTCGTKIFVDKSLTVGTQYLRQCESQKYAQERISYQLKLHGTIGVSFGVLLCDDDGSYGAYKVVDGSAYCTWRDNTNLGTWQYADDDRSSLNCNCARDTKIFSNAGKTQTQKCSGSGNYRALQTEGTLLYCVDKDGFRKTRKEDTPKTEEDCALYASY